jgi:hypothetical protein
MGIFSRTRDIIAANMTDLLDRAEDPAKMIRMIILEMEETLVEVRASAARTIADQKEMRRQITKLERSRRTAPRGNLRDRRSAGELRGRHHQAPEQAPRSARPPEFGLDPP